MAYRDLREWLEQVDKIGELVRIEGAHWDLEASAVVSLTNKMVLFDRFPGYPAGFRVLSRMAGHTRPRFFITAGWSTEAKGLELTRAWLKRLREFKPVPPKWVEKGPIMENVEVGEKVNLLKFPVPRAFEREGGRYIGTGHTVITKDPDTGMINMGTYRMQLHDRNTVGIHASEGKDGRIIIEKYHRQGKPCPAVAVVGMDPGLFTASINHVVHTEGITELDFAGWLKGQPEQVFPGKVTGLPIPAYAEIAVEGEIPPGVMRAEGPFAEWCGYSQKKEIPVMQVKAVYHRNDPILTVSIGREVKPPGKRGLRTDFQRSALIWDQMEKAGIRGIHGVATYGRRLIVISLKNLYAGHSMQAATVATQCHAGAYGNTYVIVVDHDIDPNNIQDVLWAVINRTEPKRAIQVLEHCWASQLTIQDPAQVQKAEYAMRPERATYISKAIIDACKPVEWDPTWHQDVYISPDLKAKVRERWGALLGSERGDEA